MNWLAKPGFGLRITATFVFLSLGITVAGWLYYREQSKIIQQQRTDELSAIADLKVNQIEAWRKERFEDGEALREEFGDAPAMGSMLKGDAPPSVRLATLAWMSRYIARRGYSGFTLLDTKGAVRGSTLPAAQAIQPDDLGLVANALRSHAVILSELHRNSAGAIRMSLAVPLDAPGKPELPGAFLLEIEPARVLYPLIQTWPTPSPTAETLVLRRDGDEALFLNELRHRRDTALTVRLPIGRTVVPAVPPGPGAVGEARDYRGIPVVAATRRIADSSWILVAKMDVDDIYGSLRQTAVSTGLGTLFLFVAAATGVLMLWRERERIFHRSQRASEMERAALAERLDLLSLHASDMILWTDPDGRIQDANKRATDSYGFEREDLPRLTMRELSRPAARPDFERQWARLGEQYETVLETEHERRDGSTFPVEISIRPVVFVGNICFQCMIRDISERKRADEESRLLSSIVESSSDAIISEDLAGNVVSWNKGAERAYGYSASEMVSRPLSILVPPGAHDDYPRIIQSLAGGQNIEHFETEQVRKDGQRIIVSVTISALRDHAQRTVGAAVIARDISARRRAEVELANAHSQTNAILESISDGFTALDREWRYSYVNPMGAKLVGKTTDELMGRIFWEVWPEASDSPFGIAYRRAAAENVPTQTEAFYAPLNRWYESRCYPSPNGVIFFYTDTTERKRSDTALRMSEERYRSLAVATSQIVWTTDARGRVVEDAPMWRAFTGQSLDEVVGWGRLGAVHPEDRGELEKSWSKAVHTSERFCSEYRLRRCDGEYRWMSAHAVPVREDEGALREWIGTCTDITEHKQAAEAIQQLNQVLEQRVLERTAQVLESNRELEAFAYSVSHDLRAPLRAVNGFSRILLEEHAPQLSDDARHCVDMISGSSQRMGELIDGLLKFSRLSRQELRKLPVAPADIVRLAWEDVRAEHTGRRVDFNIGDLSPCQGDPLLLRQVFVNLFSNALKFTRPRDVSRVEVGTISAGIRPDTRLPPNDCPVYFVRDNGVGFDARYKDKLFGVFQRLHRAEEFEGSGVGLATVQRIIQRHGGTVWAESVLNEGTTFYFTLWEAKPANGDGNSG